MRRATVRAGAAAVLLAGVAVVGATGADGQPVPAPVPQVKVPAGDAPGTPPVDVNKLKADIAALARQREDAAREVGPSTPAVERAVLKAQLLDRLKRLAERPPAPPPPVKGAGPRFEVPDRGRPADLVRAAENLFRDGDYDAALRTLQGTDRAALGRDDRAFAQYLSACCLRRLNRRAEAAAVYREVAAGDDEFLAGCAVSQLDLMRSARELEAQIEQLRPRANTR